MSNGRRTGVAALALAVVAVLTPWSAPGASAEPGAGDTVYVGAKSQGYPGSGIHGVFEQTPADPGNPGTPDYWAYCIEHDVTAKPNIAAGVGTASDFLGSNHFTDPAVQARVLWVLAHSYPALSLADFATASGVPGIALNDAIEATQYAIWRYTDVGYDASWAWASDDSEDAYWYLVNGANASGGLTPADLSTTATIGGPAAAQVADSLVGPFTVGTDQPSVSVSVAPALTLTDAGGTPIDASTVVDGQQLYLDLRGTTAAGSATVTVTATGSNATGKIISVPTQPGGTATAGDHAQSLILVAPSTATVTDQAAVAWAAAAAPAIGTTLVDAADGDHVLPSTGGSVTDTVAYANLVPGTTYTITGELMRRSDGSATGITGSATFTPTQADGTVEVHFTVPAGYAGQQLVAFEELVETGSAVVVAEHKDIDDAAQTVTVRAGPTVTTQASAATARVGAALHDVVTITGLVPGGTAQGTATLYGPLTTVDDTVCVAANEAGSVTFAPQNGTSATPSITVVRPGLYTWQVTVSADADNDAATHECGLAAETTLVEDQPPGTTPSTVSLTTETSTTAVKPGKRIHDVVTITGFVPGHGATGSATLYGPFASRAAITCTPAHAVATVPFTPGNGVIRTPAVPVTRTGYYTWVAATTADSHNTAATHACGLASETTLVRKPSYRPPVVSTGYRSAGPDVNGRRKVSRVIIPALGVNARTTMVGIRKGTMQVPGQVARTGQLSRSAAAGDLIGTTVIAGHVSDRRDRPGAFWRLSRIRPGQVVTVREGSRQLRYRVTSVERFSRSKRLPQRFFSTTGEHRLVLISCAGRVGTSNGGFHYRQNVVVTATPLDG
ncbi:hypothetical protein GCM10009788_20990 [Nocardioides humi]|uniref:TQXA domain-containing protein n=2 Tax=Nocardioides humi TaxID=449461 RepID=A0ABN2ACR9_9ACTN